jgi:hypothetical protein
MRPERAARTMQRSNQMQSNAAKWALGGVVLAVVVILFIVLSGGDDDSSSSTTTTSSGGSDTQIATITIKNGEPVGGVQDLTFTEGDDIRFRVDSDVSDEVHFHGYDVGKDVEAGGSVTFDVPATITGKFEVELEDRVTQIAEITVNPS